MANVAVEQHRRENLVIGLGRTGLSAARYLGARGERVWVTDRLPWSAVRERLQRAAPDAEWFDAGPGILPEQVERVIVSPGVPGDNPLVVAARESGREVAGDIELFAAEARAPIAGITGSNGKSTVVCLVAALLEAAGRRVLKGGNLGPPALELLDAPEPDAYVLELSSFQLETTDSLDAGVGVVLNISEDHMDRYPDFAAYAAAKARLVGQSRVAVLNRDDAAVAAMAGDAPRVIWFGAGRPEEGGYGIATDADGRWLVRGRERLIATDAVPLPGEHNLLNVLAALATVEALGHDPRAVVDALKAFRGLAHRMQVVAERDGVVWINDSKATNVAAAVAAIEGMDRPLILIAGGQGKGQDFKPLGHALARSDCRGLVVYGEDADSLAAMAPEGMAIRRAEDLEQAVTLARDLALPGSAVLLSPACASFDQFAGFAERGQVFMDAVEGRA